MRSEPLDRLERLFQAVNLLAPEEREAFLDAACENDLPITTCADRHNL
jgi:hypothetical protein